jgi:hypothetical protein
MKQILQNLKTGKTELTKIPCPETKSGHLLIKTTASLISAGTERITGPQITHINNGRKEAQNTQNKKHTRQE